MHEAMSGGTWVEHGEQLGEARFVVHRSILRRFERELALPCATAPALAYSRHVQIFKASSFIYYHGL